MNRQTSRETSFFFSGGKHRKTENARFQPDDEKAALKGPFLEEIFVFEKGVALRATTVGQKLE